MKITHYHQKRRLNQRVREEVTRLFEANVLSLYPDAYFSTGLCILLKGSELSTVSRFNLVGQKYDIPHQWRENDPVNSIHIMGFVDDNSEVMLRRGDDDELVRGKYVNSGDFTKKWQACDEFNQESYVGLESDEFGLIFCNEMKLLILSTDGSVLEKVYIAQNPPTHRDCFGSVYFDADGCIKDADVLLKWVKSLRRGSDETVAHANMLIGRIENQKVCSCEDDWVCAVSESIVDILQLRHLDLIDFIKSNKKMILDRQSTRFDWSRYIDFK